jgi:hypothetical protein
MKKPYSAPTITTRGMLEMEHAGATRARLRCAAGHYVRSTGESAAAGEKPPPMLIDDCTRAVVLHRRICEVIS